MAEYAAAQTALAILALPGIGKKRAASILGKCESFPQTWKDLIGFLQDYAPKMPDQFEIEKAWNDASEIIDRSFENKIHIITIFDSNFPAWIRNIPDPPIVLYIKGDSSVIYREQAVAVIGTREPTDYGKACAARIASILAQHLVTVVSGLAKGCDSAAHEGCISAGGKTIAVMAGGLDKVYPAENKNLASQIEKEHGCLVSEYPIGQRPFRTNFVERDRLQSAFSKALFVVETGIKGGTLHTVDFARKQGRSIFCLSHPSKYETHEKVQGNKDLIRRRVATPVGNPDDIQILLDKTIDRENRVENINEQTSFGF